MPNGVAYLFSHQGPGILDPGTGGWAVYDVQRYFKLLAAARRTPALDPGTVTGEWNPGTVRAMQAWQRADGYDVTTTFGDMEATRLQRALVAARITLYGDAVRPSPWSTGIETWRVVLRQAGGLAAAYRARVAASTPRAATPAASPAASQALRPATTRTVATTSAANLYPGTFLNTTTTIRRGMCGELVRLWQIIVTRLPGITVSGVSEDGNFGAGTEAATKVVQRAVGVRADGIVGAQTRAAVRAHLTRRGITVTGSASTATAAPCAGTVVSSSSGNAASGSSGGSGTELVPTTTEAGLGGIGDKVLNFVGEYGPVLAIGLGVAAFAVLSNPGGRR